jgi:hypothetical protein
MPTHPETTDSTLPGWPTEPEYAPAHRSDSPAAWQRDCQEVARYGQPQEVIVNPYHAAQRRGPDGRQVLGWTAASSSRRSWRRPWSRLRSPNLGLIARGLWCDMQKRG